MGKAPDHDDGIKQAREQKTAPKTMPNTVADKVNFSPQQKQSNLKF
jgi:hypothetical protein